VVGATAQPGVGVVRPRLLSRLDAARSRRLTALVADAGFGKSVLLEQWLASPGAAGACVVRPGGRDLPAVATSLVEVIARAAPDEGARLRLVLEGGSDRGDEQPSAVAAMLCAALEGRPELDLLLVLDDAHLLAPTATRLVESLVLHGPATLHLVVAGRTPLALRHERLQEQPLALTGTDLVLDDDETASVLRAALGDDGLLPQVRSLTGGWPAAVGLAAAALARRPEAERPQELARLHGQGAQVLGALAREVLRTEPEAARRLCQVVAPYDGFTAELAEELGCPDAAGTLAELQARGMVVRLGFEGFQFYAFPRLLREFLRAQLPMGADERPGLVHRAAAWFKANGQPEGALRCALDQQDSAWVARLLRSHGAQLVDAGRGRRVAQALQAVAPTDRDAAIDEVEGRLHEAEGDAERALESYQRAVPAGRPVPARLGWRLGRLHYQLGQLEQALVVMDGVAFGGTRDDALVLAWRATVLWARGEVELAQASAVPAQALAAQLDDPVALAAAHTALAMIAAHTGDRDANREHYEVALAQAERAADVQQVVRIRNNLGSRLLEEGELLPALSQLEIAIELAAASGLGFYLSLALANRGELHFHLGQLDAATADLEAARDLDRELGTQNGSSALVQLGHVYRHRGYLTMSRLSYEEAIAAGRRTGDVNLIVPALCGLAQLLADTDSAYAEQLASEALAYDAGLGRVAALLAAGWVALARGDLPVAGTLAQDALTEAQLRRDRLGRAEALHVLHLADPAAGADDPRLAEAVSLLDAVGAPVWRALMLLSRARRGGATPAALAVVADVEELGRALGARSLVQQAARVAAELDLAGGDDRVEVVTLGGFRVRLRGRALGLADWPDESARDLLKRLTTRDGTPWPRAVLARTLGAAAPEDLDAAVEQARQALDPDGRHAPDHYVAEDEGGLLLRNCEVDVHAFLREASEGLHRDDGVERLRRAEARYAGDYLEEHPGEPWALALREEARGRYVEVSRALAGAAIRSGDPEAAARYARRILERDPYDERAHLALVAALDALGRGAEARRCYSAYVQRLDELGLEAVPWRLVGATITAA
jgi:ATP/maltotriose-dependent transcriptional regulator MalT/DNA-binding SARP family transcriptional activator